MDEAIDEDLLSRIEDASLNASAPSQQRWLDGWILRYSPGKARRARCINAVATGRLPLPLKLKLAAELYQQADLPLMFRVTRFTEPAALDLQLDGLGWSKVDTTRVQLRRNLRPTTLAALPPGTHWAQLDGPAFAEAVGEMRGSSALHRASHAQRLAASPVAYKGYVIRRDDDGFILACGQSAQESELVGLYDVHTADSQRGKRLATLLCEHMLTQAALNGAETAYLQVEAGNSSALRVYGRLGFVDGYTYHYREAPSA